MNGPKVKMVFGISFKIIKNLVWKYGPVIANHLKIFWTSSGEIQYSRANTYCSRSHIQASSVDAFPGGEQTPPQTSLSSCDIEVMMNIREWDGDQIVSVTCGVELKLQEHNRL